MFIYLISFNKNVFTKFIFYLNIYINIMTPTQIVQGSINLFIAVCILITFIQDIWYNPSLTSTQQSSYSSQYQSSN